MYANLVMNVNIQKSMTVCYPRDEYVISKFNNVFFSNLVMNMSCVLSVFDECVLTAR